jgi:hypothetical protein
MGPGPLSWPKIKAARCRRPPPPQAPCLAGLDGRRVAALRAGPTCANHDFEPPDMARIRAAHRARVNPESHRCRKRARSAPSPGRRRRTACRAHRIARHPHQPWRPAPPPPSEGEEEPCRHRRRVGFARRRPQAVAREVEGCGGGEGAAPPGALGRSRERRESQP